MRKDLTASSAAVNSLLAFHSGGFSPVFFFFFKVISFDHFYFLFK